MNHDYLVVWEDYAGVNQNRVTTDAPPSSLTPDDWVKLAAASQGYNNEEIDALIEWGYGLYLVCPFPTVFYA